MRSSDELVDVYYWLPVSRVHITGSVVASTSTFDPASTVMRPSAAVVTVLTRPDYAPGPCRLSIPANRWMKQHAKIELLPDGRLSGTESTNEDHRWDGLSAVLGLAATGARIGAAIGGPVGAAAGVAAGTFIGAGSELLDRLTSGDRAQLFTAGPPMDPNAIDFEGLRIEANYVADDQASAQILGRLRQGEATARIDFSSAVADPQEADVDSKLEQLRKRLRDIRAELARAEVEYQKWLDSQITTTTETFDVEIKVADLPTAANGPGWLDVEAGSWSPELIAFRDACKALKVLVTCDPLLEPSVSSPTDPPPIDRVRYRPLRPVQLRTWATHEQRAPVGQDGQSADENQAASTVLSNTDLQSIQRLLVALPGYDRDLPAFAGNKDSAISLAFNADGALTSVSSDQTGSGVKAAAALSALPGTVKDAFDIGSDIATPFTAGGRAKALQDQVDEAKARAALAPAADPNQKLEDQVTKAELQARLRTAQLGATAASPPISVVVVGGSAAS